MLIHGRRAPIVGRISMDYTTVDVTDLPHVATGDRATLVGRCGEEELAVGEVARAAGTIAYELTCGIGPRVPRLVRAASESLVPSQPPRQAVREAEPVPLPAPPPPGRPRTPRPRLDLSGAACCRACCAERSSRVGASSGS